MYQPGAASRSLRGLKQKHTLGLCDSEVSLPPVTSQMKLQERILCQ